jgi:small subunit ribosomal protein S20
MRKSAKQRIRNRAVRSQVRQVIRTYREADPSKKRDLLPRTTSEIDNAVRKGIIKQATANRMKSRFARHANAAQKEPA